MLMKHNKPDDNWSIQEIIQEIIDDQDNAITVEDVDETDKQTRWQ